MENGLWTIGIKEVMSPSLYWSSKGILGNLRFMVFEQTSIHP